MTDPSPFIPDTDVFELDYSWNGTDVVRLADYARNIHASRKKLRKNDVPIHSTSGNLVRTAIVFIVIAVLVIAVGASAGAVKPALTVAALPGELALLSIVLAAVYHAQLRKTVRSAQDTPSGKLTISADGIKDEANGSTHSYTWEKTETCVVTEKVIVFIFRDSDVLLFIPATEEAKQTVITAFRRFGRFYDVLMRSVK